MSAFDPPRMTSRSVHSGFWAQLIGTLQTWNDARMTRKALSKLSDRELNDIGLTRFDIDRLL